MASLIFVIGLALAAAGITFLVGLATRSFVILFDYFGVSHYFLIGIGLFLMALDRIMRQKPGEGFWGMKHTRAK
jgi:predicted Co/Zn/Cd cation transporter (cation efflux family)